MCDEASQPFVKYYTKTKKKEDTQRSCQYKLEKKVGWARLSSGITNDPWESLKAAKKCYLHNEHAVGVWHVIMNKPVKRVKVQNFAYENKTSRKFSTPKTE